MATESVPMREGAIKVELNLHELKHGADVGVVRNIRGLFKGKARYGIPPESAWRANIEGACGEKAVSKYFDRYWYGAINKFGMPDVGPWQVRTVLETGYSLLLHPSDKDHQKVLLVEGGYPPVYHIVGWAYVGDWKYKPLWREIGRPAWFVPQSYIEPMTTFDKTT